jgi:hypothetical protein
MLSGSHYPIGGFLVIIHVSFPITNILYVHHYRAMAHSFEQIRLVSGNKNAPHLKCPQKARHIFGGIHCYRILVGFGRVRAMTS